MFRRDFFGFLGLSPLAFLKEKPDKDGSTFIGLLKNCSAPLGYDKYDCYCFRRKHWNKDIFLRICVAKFHWCKDSCFEITNNKDEQFYVIAYLHVDDVSMVYSLNAEELSSKDWSICEEKNNG